MSKRIILCAKIIIISRINEQFLLFFYFCTSFTEFSYLCSQMAVLHIFNPEHDIALAANLSNFTSPHAGRQLRHDLGYLPAIWASADDYVLVENVEDAQRDYARLMHRQFNGFIDKRQLSTLNCQLSRLGVGTWRCVVSCSGMVWMLCLRKRRLQRFVISRTVNMPSVY